MLTVLHALGIFACDLLKSRCRLQSENLFLRHQLSIALRQTPPPVSVGNLIRLASSSESGEAYAR